MSYTAVPKPREGTTYGILGNNLSAYAYDAYTLLLRASPDERMRLTEAGRADDPFVEQYSQIRKEDPVPGQTRQYQPIGPRCVLPPLETHMM